MMHQAVWDTVQCSVYHTCAQIQALLSASSIGGHVLHD